jgi:UDP-N-acetylmuramoylalanine-D-glutamate ligase
LDISTTKFIGEHNRSNLAAAFKVATYLGVPESTAIKALQKTEPLPHRLQNVGVHGGVTWVNDSIATAPEATIAALKALGSNVETIFLGGFERGYDFTELANFLTDSSVKNMVIFPVTGPKIKALIPAGANKTFLETSDMDEAVRWAAAHTTPGKTALLSCASPSFNLYKDFNVRGEAFVAAVEALGN